MLTVEGLDVFYGAVHAVKGVSLEADQGEIVTLIGANGAGKTTLLRTISGLVAARAGSIRWDGQDITRLPPHEIVGLGISQSPEGRLVFANLSVEDNLELGGYRRKERAALREDRDHVFHLFPRLLERRRQAAGTLSGGEQQMLAIGRALMSRPRLLLLDEPSLGLAPLLVREIFKTVVEINGRGVTVLLVEQNAHMALSIAGRGYVLETGHEEGLSRRLTPRGSLGSSRARVPHFGRELPANCTRARSGENAHSRAMRWRLSRTRRRLARNHGFPAYWRLSTQPFLVMRVALAIPTCRNTWPASCEPWQTHPGVPAYGHAREAFGREVTGDEGRRTVDDRACPLRQCAGKFVPRRGEKSMMSLVRNFVRDENGEDLIEYGLLAAFVAAVALVTIIADPIGIKGSLVAAFNKAKAALDAS
ncbi:MAG: ATP-binding cassette domain-containing protein [Candidatus Eisenbacteria bacterium]|uniref:ATP-binding cassette domain-containing protein n=1 Tax=Eiseniibacteriota bacterium TaxID=2212470 RepID=A0A538TFC1_UNCEI|nr:MAG: ATP-binding cassette domain-containing protein [Candidatus Eisenbacteria bacterium]